MQATAKSLGIDQLSLAERILLVEEIWDSIAAEAEAVEIPQSTKMNWTADSQSTRLTPALDQPGKKSRLACKRSQEPRHDYPP